MHFTIILASVSFIFAETTTTETSLVPVVRRWKRHCGNQGCAPTVCQECPQCCGAPQLPPYNPTFNINFSCCGAPRPSPQCCPAMPPPQPKPAVSCCGASPVPSPCCPQPQPPTALICCKQAPVPENPCCQAIAQAPAPKPAVSPCCAAAPSPANPCCQPVQPAPCTCSAPRPVPCRCASIQIPFECPNCDEPAPRCSMYAPMGCSMRRMRRDVHEQILQHIL
ncbi:unnamed protein product [Caenorhabditis angaria]|uniref:IGFBP N-terminal domain-containing protein n=1 Tax=Caenorhabditis angaria TaxID=860376 RepID=A0A9P1N9B1_9PELO|nr:unnamed protein product [Caenorhabditis angaria]